MTCIDELLVKIVQSQKDEYRWRSLDTVQEAFDWLQKVDTTLPDLSELSEALSNE